MRFPLLQPRWLGIHLVAVLSVLGCLALGSWQFDRAQMPDRSVITNPVQDVAAATDIDTLLEPGAYMPQDLANEAVRATGSYDVGNQLLSPALSPEGDEGYYLVAPLVTDDGAAVIVNRGWLPAAEAEAAAPLPAPDGQVTVSGWLLPPQNEASQGYSAIVPDGQVPRIAPALLVNEWPYPLYTGYINLAEQVPADPERAAAGLERFPPPEPPQKIIWDFRNAGYAAQWVVFAAAAVAFWISLMRRELAAHRAAAGTGGESGPPPPDTPHPSAAAG